MLNLIGSAISAGSALLSGKAASSANQAAQKRAALQAAEANRIARNQARVARQREDRFIREERAIANTRYQQNYDMQKEFAQNGLRWKVEDARAAGIHPLYALGANTVSFSPASVGGGSYSSSSHTPSYSTPGSVADTAMANAIGSAGQDIGRAVMAMQTPQERMQNALGLENMALQNDLLRAQITSIRNPLTGTGPGMPGIEQGNVAIEGFPVKPTPGWSDTQDIEDVYGEPLSWAYGVLRAGRDYITNYESLRRRAEAYKATLPRSKFRYEVFSR